MRKGFREIDDSDLEVAAGGYRVGSDDYSIQEYNEAGVTWDRHTWSKDKYYYQGEEISQKKAESITSAYQSGMRAKPR